MVIRVSLSELHPEIIVDLDISSLILQVPGTGTSLNYGRLCLNNDQTIDDSRLEFFGKCLLSLSERLQMGIRPKTIQADIQNLNQFNKYLLNNSNSKLLENVNYQELLAGYRRYLIRKARAGAYKVNTIAAYFRSIRNIILDISDDLERELVLRVPTINKLNSQTKNVYPPTTIEMVRHLKLSKLFFSTISNHVLEFKPYPIKLVFEEKTYWGIPSTLKSWVSAESVRNANRPTDKAYDHLSGNLKPPKTLEKYVYPGRSQALRGRQLHDRLLLHQQEANTNKFHQARVRQAKFAKLSFLALFFSATGMNLSVAAELEWSGSYKISNQEVGFKSIKYRANDKDVEFIIASNFIKFFKTYLKLREYLIEAHGGKPPSTLFFEWDMHGQYRPISSSLVLRINSFFQDNFYFDVSISNQEWRVNRTQWWLENRGLFEAAEASQNTPRTLLKHYSTGNPEKSKLELNSFFEKYSESLVVDNGIETKSLNVGECKSPDNPQVKLELPNRRPDCVDMQGCLFCENFAIKTNEAALRKIVSYKYVLSELGFSEMVSKQQFSADTDLVFEVLDSLIAAIKSSKSLSDKKFNSVIKDIEVSENLTPYWRERYEMLIDLGAII